MAMNAFTRNKFRLGADVAFAVGPYGGQASAATGITFRGGIYSYSRSKGLFAGFSLEGMGIGSKVNLNRAYYGAPVGIEEILAGGHKTPASGQKLIEMLQKFK
jgi:lipid-binding SYLF domain-containing protein